MAKKESKPVEEKSPTQATEETILDLDSIPEFEATKSENQDEELEDIED